MKGRKVLYFYIENLTSWKYKTVLFIGSTEFHCIFDLWMIKNEKYTGSGYELFKPPPAEGCEVSHHREQELTYLNTLGH